MILKPILALALVAVASCTMLVPETVNRISTLSPLTADPADFEFAVDLPAGLDIPKGAATLLMQVKRSDTGQTASEVFILERREADAIQFRMAQADLARFRAMQKTASAWKAKAPNATLGTFAMEVTACETASGPAKDAQFSVDVKLAKDGSFMPLMQDVPVEKLKAKGKICAR
ncbi:MAG: hypothetical protein ABI459_05210 [Deltaproteobacteria bacterium]